ncbi:DUF4865 family protein [Methylobacterium sp. C25]|uniref:DUF4865 family protein n=1 Tax=Methylobacterium sp. C25 TaxID=2721622 RepID=UPI001F3CAE44|nr:DUF4865 family protein [Methylobacterium sp. C25]MCE4225478.1 DUF4865 family protein [Methylobacterium sp. C25]
MILKQYVIDLPADYDMQIIRDRVARAADAFDRFPGLGLKAFLAREKGRHGADSNQYAPVYLWPEAEALWDFVAGSGFDGVARSFGRPSIQTWLGFALARSQAGRDPTRFRSLVREDVTIERGIDLAALRSDETRNARTAVAEAPGLCLRAVGLNIETWRLVRFDFWDRPQDALPVGSRSFEILHTSAPRVEDLDFQD